MAFLRATRRSPDFSPKTANRVGVQEQIGRASHHRASEQPVRYVANVRPGQAATSCTTSQFLERALAAPEEQRGMAASGTACGAGDLWGAVRLSHRIVEFLDRLLDHEWNEHGRAVRELGL